MVDYKIRCESCKQCYPRKDMILSFGRRKCKSCSTVKTIQRDGVIAIPKFLRDKYNFKVGSKIKLVPSPNGILIKNEI